MGPASVSSLTLPPVPESAGRARRFLRARLDAVGRDDLADSATLLVSEIVTNVVLHAATWLEVHVRATAGGVRVDVLDRSGVVPIHREYAGFTSTGHGLGLVEHLADDFGVDLLDTGKSVWFSLDRGAAGPREVPAPDADTAAPPTAVDRPVVLVGLPVRLWIAARQHHEAALRELYLRQTLRGESADPEVRVRVQLVVAALDVALEAALTPGGAVAPDHQGPGYSGPGLPTTRDLELTATLDMAAGVIALQGALEEAERLAREAELLVLPALPEVVAVRDWVCEQVVAQLNDVAPTRWSQGAAVPRTDSRGAVEGWDSSAVLGSTRAVVAGDDTNRILAVSPAAAALLRWDARDLVGRRVIDLIPPSLHEAHLAGFTRHQTTGETHVIGMPVELPVLRSDGTEVQVAFLLERARAPHGRSVYLAWLTPLDMTATTPD